MNPNPDTIIEYPLGVGLVCRLGLGTMGPIH